jgi:hypothetical protein
VPTLVSLVSAAADTVISDDWIASAVVTEI